MIGSAISQQVADKIPMSGGVSALVGHHSIPIEPQSLEVSDNGVGGAGHVAWSVDVLDSEQPPAGLATGIEKAAQG